MLHGLYFLMCMSNTEIKRAYNFKILLDVSSFNFAFIFEVDFECTLRHFPLYRRNSNKVILLIKAYNRRLLFYLILSGYMQKNRHSLQLHNSPNTFETIYQTPLVLLRLYKITYSYLYNLSQ